MPNDSNSPSFGSFLPGIAGMVGGLASNLLNASAQRRENRRQEAFSREMWEKQGQREIDYFNMQNAYNDPSAVMDRLKNAGLNPNLVYGNGSSTMAAASVSPKQAHGISPSPARYDLGSLVTQQLALKQMNANIARTEAETKAIEARTANQLFTNEVRSRLGVDSYISKEAAASSILQTKDNKQLAEWEAFKQAINPLGRRDDITITKGGANIPSNSPLIKAIGAAFQQTIENVNNAKRLGNLRDAESAIKSFQVKLSKQGLSPNSPWYVKFLADLYSKLDL